MLVLGQKTKKVVDKLNDWSGNKEVYYVLTSDKSTRHGSYQLIGYKKTVLTTGYYNEGEKDSLWVEYDWHGTSGGRTIRNEGDFSNGQKVGVWKYYNYKGKLVQEYDYTNNRIVSSTEISPDIESIVIVNKDTISVKLVSPLLFKGSNSMIKHHINKNLNYPQSAVEDGINGKVIVTFTVDINGIASDHIVVNKMGNGFDEAALFAVKKIPNDWIPGMLDGEPVKVIVNMPISFTLN